MMPLLEKIRTACDSKRLLAVSAVAYFCSQLAIGVILEPLGIGRVMRLQTTLSAEVMASVLNGWRDAGLIHAYITHFYVDFFHPVFYGTLLIALLSRLLNSGNLPSKWNILLLAPAAAGVMDIGENILQVMFVADPASLTSAAANVSGAATLAKWGLAFFSVCVIIILAAKRVIRGRASRVPR
jgi:hypothetical protein